MYWLLEQYQRSGPNHTSRRGGAAVDDTEPSLQQHQENRPMPIAETKPLPPADPIFAAIENHQRLDKACLGLEAACGSRDAIKRDLDRAHDAAENAAWEMARTKPTTAAGASALLTYIATGPITGLFELGETHWHETAFRTVVASLAKITGQSQPIA